jgi:hypothetical protein
MNKTAFGTLMALEPAIGVLTGLVVLHQQPSLAQLAGIVLVIIAGAAAQRGSQRRPAAGQQADADPIRPPAQHPGRPGQHLDEARAPCLNVGRLDTIAHFPSEPISARPGP